MSKNVIETIVGAAVLGTAILFAAFAYQSSNLKPVDGYELLARFSTVDGIGTGSDIRIGGIKVGVVGAMNLDEKSYEALLSLQLRDSIKIPEDSTAAVVSAGLLGSKYVEIIPGGAAEMLGDGDEIAFTQSSVSIESLIGKMVHSGGGVENESDDAGALSIPGGAEPTPTPGADLETPLAAPAASD